MLKYLFAFVFVSSCSEAEKASLSPIKEAKTAVSIVDTHERALAIVEPKKPTELLDANPSKDRMGSSIKDTEFRLSGEVSALRNSKLAFRQVGFIEEVKVKSGALLKKGDVLASLDARDFKIRLALAKAKRDQAEIAKRTAEKEFRREQQLKKENASTGTVYDKMEAAFQQASLNLELADLEVSSAELAVKDTQLQAPYDCVVANQMIHEGENVPSGTAVFEVYDTSEPEITLSAPESLMSSFAIGTTLKINIPSAGYSGKGEIIRIVPVISQKTRTFQVIAKLSQYNPKIVPGSYAEATLK